MDNIHKLNDTWVLWEHQKNNDNNYDQNTKELGSFDTLQDFWRYYNNYPVPSAIFSDGVNKPLIQDPDREVASISLFKKGILPKWEDPKNNEGGEIAIRKFKNIQELDELWENISMLCVGSQIYNPELVTGIRVVDSSIPNKKALYRVELWFSDKNKKDEIENSFKSLLNLGPFVQIHYKEHSTAVESTPTRYQNNNRRRVKDYYKDRARRDCTSPLDQTLGQKVPIRKNYGNKYNS